MGNRKKHGCLASLLAVVLLGGLVVWGINSCEEHVFQPETPEQAEKRREQKAKREVRPEVNSPADVEPPLLVTGWNWRTEHGHAIAEGEVKNVSKRRIKNVEAIVKFYTDDKQFITSGNALIEYNPILPGQSSPFKVYATYNPRMKSASLTFKHLMGGTIAHKLKKLSSPPPKATNEKLKRRTNVAVAAVVDSFRPKRPYDWKAAEFEDGIAVLVDEQAAYWVGADGKVHAANGTARTWSPGIPYSPTGIDFNSVKAACE